MFNKVGIIGAMQEEVEVLLSKIENSKVKEKAGMKYYQGKLNGKEVVIVKCGIGKVNAAVCTQALIDEFGVDALINTGVAGSLNNDINIGDIVISKDTVNHDFDTTAFGDEYGVISYMDTSFFEADARLIEKAKESCIKANKNLGFFVGRVLSGDQFIAFEEKKQWLVKQFNGYCVEMEGVAIGQTAHLNKIPFVILRAISDKGDNSAEMNYEEFKIMAIDNLSKMVMELVQRI